MPMPFGGKLDCIVRKLPYSITNLAAFDATFTWMPDAWITQDATDPRTYWRLSQTEAVEYDIENTGGLPPADDLGTVYIDNGMNYGPEGTNDAPYFVFYSMPPGGGTTETGGAYIQVVAANPPAFSTPSIESAIPFVQEGHQLAFWATSDDPTGPTPSAVLMNPTVGNASSPWYHPLPNLLLGQCEVLDFPGDQTIGLFRSGFLWNLQRVTFDAAGAFTTASIKTSQPTGLSFVDSPIFSTPYGDPAAARGKALRCWVISADNSGGAQPQVADGSPVFVVAPDLSVYYEIVFHPLNSSALPNDEGGYGPPWDYAINFAPLIVSDPLGNAYYLQFNAATNVLDVYSFGIKLPGGRVHGTFTGFVPAGQFGGGNK